MAERHEGAAGLTDRLGAALLAALPHHALSRAFRALGRCRVRAAKDLLIRLFAARFGVDWSEADPGEPHAYPDFNAFFTRALRPGLRPLPEAPHALACPVDGAVSAIGELDGDDLVQAKGETLSLHALLGGEAGLTERFRGGSFVTLYLAPRDYHRVHAPTDARLTAMTHVPGRLYPVARFAVRAVPSLFTRNERVVAVFRTPQAWLAVVWVGALNVGGIETVWAGEVAPGPGRCLRRWSYPPDRAPAFARGEEIGRFNFGSTVIVISPPETVAWDDGLGVASRVRLGQALGWWREHAEAARTGAQGPPRAAAQAEAWAASEGSPLR